LSPGYQDLYSFQASPKPVNGTLLWLELCFAVATTPSGCTVVAIAFNTRTDIARSACLAAKAADVVSAILGVENTVTSGHSTGLLTGASPNKNTPCSPPLGRMQFTSLLYQGIVCWSTLFI